MVHQHSSARGPAYQVRFKSLSIQTDEGFSHGRRYVEILVSKLAQTDAIADLLVEKGFVTRDEILRKVSEQQSIYVRMLNPTRNNRLQTFQSKMIRECWYTSRRSGRKTLQSDSA
jgi:hypothetical protein